MSEEKIDELRKKISSLKKDEEAIKAERLALEQQEEKERELERQRREQEQKKKEAEELAKKKKSEAWKMRKKTERVYVKADVRLQKNFFKSILSINNECKLVFTNKGVEYRGVDPAHILMKVMKLPVCMFEEFRLNGSEHELVFSVDAMYSLLRRQAKGKKAKSIEFNQYTDDPSIFLSWESEFGGRFCRLIGAVDTASLPTPKTPILDLPAKFDAPTIEVLDFLCDAEEISDYFEITAGPDGVRFYASGDVDDVEYKPRIGDGYDVKRHFKSLFSIDCFVSAVKDAKLFFDTLIFSIGNDKPVQIDGRITEESSQMEMMILVAPRIESG